MKKLKITDVIRKITLAGTVDLPQTSAKRVHIINTLCLVTAVLAFVIGNIFYLKTRSLSIELPAMLEGILFCLVIYLNSDKKYKLAGLTLVGIFCVSSIYFEIILGSIIPLILITFLLFSLSLIIFQDRKSRLLSFLFSLVPAVFPELDQYYHWSRHINLDEASYFLIRWTAMAVFLGLDIIVLNFFVEEIYKLQQQQEKSINRQAKLLHQLKGANKIIRTGFFKASHELRNQLNPITLCIYYMQQMIDKNPNLLKIKDSVEIMATSMNNAGIMINNVLSLSDIDAGKQYTPEYTTINVIHKIEGIVQQHSLQADQKGQKINFNIDENVPPVIITDLVVFTMAFTNLVNNAIKYSYKDSDIYIHVSKSNFDLKISVINRCEDIPEDKQVLLFDPFVRNKPSKDVEGTGLGLHVVKTKMQAIEGNVMLKSTGGFTEFSLVFPLKAGDEKDIDVEYIQDLDLTGIHILIADDEKMSLIGMEKILTMNGCKVTQTENGKDLLKELEKDIPDLIILDIHMPLMDGRQTLEKIQRDDRFKKIPVIIATGNQFGSSFISDWRKLGATDAIQKPILPKSLTAILRQRLKAVNAIITGI